MMRSFFVTFACVVLISMVVCLDGCSVYVRPLRHPGHYGSERIYDAPPAGCYTTNLLLANSGQKLPQRNSTLRFYCVETAEEFIIEPRETALINWLPEGKYTFKVYYWPEGTKAVGDQIVRMPYEWSGEKNVRYYGNLYTRVVAF